MDAVVSKDAARSPARRSSQVMNDILAGGVSSFLSIAYSLSFAALIFSGPLGHWVAYGIAASFITTAITAGLLGLGGSLPFVIAGPDGATSAVTAALVGSLMARLNAIGAPDDLLAAAMVMMALSAALTGLLLLALGIGRAGSVIRFIPYPVIGGFLGATGWLMVSGAVRVTANVELPSGAAALLDPPHLMRLMAALLVGSALFFVWRKARNPFVIAGVILGGVAIAHLGFAFAGMSVEQAQELGWLFKSPPRVGFTPTWDFGDVRNFPWSVTPALLGNLLAVVFVTAITTLLNTTGIEFVTRRDADLDHDLKTLGIANLLSAACGGYVGCTSLSRTNLNYTAGGRGRLCGLTVAAVSLALLLTNPGFLGYVPKFVLGGLLLCLGANLLLAWIIAPATRLSLVEYASLLAIAVIILVWGFIAGVVIGVVIGCATFAFSVSRVSAIKFSFDGTEYRSSLDRPPDELAILQKHGREIQGMALQSYLFFGSANRIYRHVKRQLQAAPQCRFLLVDFRLVTGVDSSGMHSFTQIKQAADESGVRLILVSLTSPLEASFRTSKFITGEVVLAQDLDHALERCERAVIAAHAAERGSRHDLVQWLTEALESARLAEQLAERCDRVEVKKDEVIASQGDPADAMHFILEGRVGVIVESGDGRTTRVRSVGFHSTIGEMGLITGQTRSATIMAEMPTVLYALSANAYDSIRRFNPALSQALLTYVMTVMAERLSFANRSIGVLRR